MPDGIGFYNAHRLRCELGDIPRPPTTMGPRESAGGSGRRAGPTSQLYVGAIAGLAEDQTKRTPTNPGRLTLPTQGGAAPSVAEWQLPVG